MSPSAQLTMSISLNAHELSSVGILVHYLYTFSGFPYKSALQAAIQAGNYTSSPELTSKYHPKNPETTEDHLS